MQTASINGHQTEASEPSPFGCTLGDWMNYPFEKLPHRCYSEPLPGFADRRSACNQFRAICQPIPNIAEKPAQYLASADANHQAQRDHVVHHQIRWKLAATNARAVSLLKNLLDHRSRKRLRHLPKIN